MIPLKVELPKWQEFTAINTIRFVPLQPLRVGLWSGCPVLEEQTGFVVRDQPDPRTEKCDFLPTPPSLESPMGTPSHGSLLHETGVCQPCAWAWRHEECHK